MYDNIVVIIPAFNPDSKMIGLVRDLFGAGLRQIVLVDDGSSKECRKYFEAAEEEFGCRVFRNAVNMGKGRALKNGFNYILNEYPDLDGVITADSDGQHTAEDIGRCADLLLEKRDKKVIFLGTRDFDAEGIPARSRFGNKITRIVLNLFCGVDISDTQTGLRGTGRGVLCDILCCIGERYEYEMNMLIEVSEKNIALEEFPISTIYIEDNASSHFNPVMDSFKIYQTILKYSFSSLLTTVIDFVLFSILIGSGMKIISATYLSRMCSMIVNFAINKKIVFGVQGGLGRQFLKYGILVAVSGTVSALMVQAMAGYLRMPPLLCKAVVDTLLYFLNYYVQRTFIFIRGGREDGHER